MNNWLIGGPVLAAVVAGWAHIQSLFAKIRSLLFVNVTVDNSLSDAVAYFCWSNMRRIKVGDHRYTSNNNFVRPVNRYQHVVYETISQGGTLFFWGWRPLLIGADTGDSTAKSTRDDGCFSFTFIRGTLDVDTLLIAAIDLYNQKTTSGFKQKRFYISKEYGSFGSPNIGNNIAPANQQLETTEDKRLWHRRVLRWTLDQLGQPEHASGRPFEFLVFPDNVWDAVKDIERWLSSERWYKEKGIPWKRGWLLYGPPGTGKTSLVRSIGEHLDIPVIVFSLSTYTDKEFQHSWNNLQHRVPCIALIEDIDTVFNGRKNVLDGSSMMGKPLSFETLLNTIDGIQNSDGVFTVVTTNCVDQLDPALGRPTNGDELATRPGRIDRAIKLDILNERERRALASRIMSDCPEHVERLVDEGEGETPAQFQERCAKLALAEFWKVNSSS